MSESPPLISLGPPRAIKPTVLPIHWQPAILSAWPIAPGPAGQNVRQLREARGLTQEQMAKLAGVPRATWGHLESGAGNPTLAVLDKVATALQVPIEELTAAPRAVGRLYPRDVAARAPPGRRQRSASCCPTRSPAC